jgi:methionyl-tRNA synthetase
LGNLAQRTLSMINKNTDAQIPDPGPFSPDDEALLTGSDEALDRLRTALDRQQFHDGLDAIWQVVRAGNGYVDAQAPWALRKSDPARMRTVLYVLAETLRRLGLLLLAVMPDTMGKLLDQLAVAGGARTLAAFPNRLVPGTALPKPEGIFPRFVEPGDKGAA